MLARFFFVMATSALTVVGSQSPASDPKSDPPEDLVLVVAASYPGANAQVVAETIAAPIEQQINGVEGMVRIESKSGNDGQYTAHLYFKSKTDRKVATILVQNRVNLALPLLPNEVKTNGVSVKVGKAELAPNQVAIAVIDRQDKGWKALEKCVGEILKRIESAGVMQKPTAFPVAGKQVSIQIDRAKCAQLGVTLADVQKAIQAGGSAKKINDLKKLAVSNKVSLADVAEIKEVIGPATVYRVNLQPAIRITGTPTDGKSVAEAAASCIALAEAEMKRIQSEGFSAEDLPVKKIR